MTLAARSKPNEPHDESASHDLGPQSQRAPRFRRPRQKRMMRKGGPNGRASPMRLGPGRWRPPIRLGSVHRPWASVGASVWVLRGPRGPPLSLLRRVCQSPPFRNRASQGWARSSTDLCLVRSTRCWSWAHQAPKVVTRSVWANRCCFLRSGWIRRMPRPGLIRSPAGHSHPPRD